MGTAIVLLIVALVLVALAYPLWRPPLLAFEEGAGPASRMEQLEDRKHALYGSIRDAGFDLRTDKMTEEDYEREVEGLKSEAVEVLAQIQAMRSEVPQASEALEAEIGALRADRRGGARASVSFCTQCGAPSAEQDRFCGSCGHRHQIEARP